MDDKIIHHGLTIKIESETDPEDPRDWDNAAVMHCEHSRYHLGDRDHKGKCCDYDILDCVDPQDQEKVLQRVKAEYMKLYLYDHSGITMKCSPFSCPWDSGQVGYIYVLPEKGREEWGKQWRAKARKCMEAEVKTYDQYLTGDVYNYTIEDGDGNHLDSCCGFFGQEYCVSEAKASAEWHAKDIQKKKEAKLKALIRNRVPLLSR